MGGTEGLSEREEDVDVPSACVVPDRPVWGGMGLCRPDREQRCLESTELQFYHFDGSHAVAG